MEGSSVLTSICGDGGPLHRVLLPLAPAGRPRPAARNGFRFLQRYGQHGGCKWCGTVPSIPVHGDVTRSLLNELLVAVLQVDEVGGFSGREIADFRGASGPRWSARWLRSGAMARCGARRTRHGPWSEAWRVGLASGVYRRHTYSQLLSPNIDLERRLGTSTLEIQAYQRCALAAIVGGVTTKGR